MEKATPRPVNPAGSPSRLLAAAAACAALFAHACVVYDDRPFRNARLLAIWEDEAPSQLYLKPSDWPGHPYFESIAAYAAWSPEMEPQAGVGGETLQGLRITPNLFEALGASPLLGRGISPQDSQVAVLGEELWQRVWGASPSVLGKTLHLDGQPHVIVGVMPAFSSFPDRGTQVWTPLDIPSGSARLIYLGRLKPGKSFEEARQAVTNVRLQRFSEVIERP